MADAQPKARPTWLPTTPSPLPVLDPDERVNGSSRTNSVVDLGHPSSDLVNDSAHQEAFETGIMPLLGAPLDSEPTSSTKDQPAGHLHNTLPNASELLSLFYSYRTRVHPFSIITPDIDEIEEKLCSLLNSTWSSRLQSQLSPADNPQWLCLLHAILASGAQMSDMPPERRQSVSRKHSQQSFQLMQSTEYLSRPFPEAIQALLLLGLVLQNDMKPQAAWALAGTTSRLAQCLETRLVGTNGSQSTARPDVARNLRLAIIWHDTLLSVAFGQIPSSYAHYRENDPPALGNDDARLSYGQAMSWISHIWFRHSCPTRAGVSLGSPLEALDELDELASSLQPHLVHPDSSKTTQQIIEHYTFRLHINFLRSKICRLQKEIHGDGGSYDASYEKIRRRFQQALKDGAESYARLRSIDPRTTRNWGLIHNGLASVLLLGLMRDTRHDPEVQYLQEDVIKSLEQTQGDADSFAGPEPAPELSETHRRALKALKTLRRLTEREVQVRDEPPTVQGSSTSRNEATKGSTSREIDSSGVRQQDSSRQTFEPELIAFDEESLLQNYDSIMSDPFGSGWDLPADLPSWLTSP